jgi:hypothetical protein
VVGLVALGVPASTPLLVAFVLTCPLMMMFMMGGMHSDHGPGRPDREPTGPTPDSQDREPTAGRQ